MNKFLKDKNRFFCFTPEVMLFTSLTEIFLAIYVYLRYKLDIFGRLVVFVLILLGAFQSVEYQVCGAQDELIKIIWSRIGFVIITLLPALGLHLISIITKKNHFLKLGYVLAIAYVLIFAFTPKAITGAVCGGNYIIFSTAQELSWTYSLYYFGFLILGIWEAAEKMGKADTQFNDKKLLWWLILGYFSFMLPMGVVYSVAPAAAWNATPSIMCGFAIILALILALKVVPLYFKSK